MLRALLWDLGGVLCHFRPEARVQCIARQSGVTEDEVCRVLTPSVLGRLDRGDMSGGELLSLVRTQLGWHCDASELGRAWVATFQPNAPVVALARRVTARAALLTNNGPPLSEQYVALLPTVAAAVPTALFSGQTTLEKPEPAAFLDACAALECDPDEAVLVDDSLQNVTAAADAGLRTHLFRGVHELASLLGSEDLLDADVSFRLERATGIEPAF